MGTREWLLERFRALCDSNGGPEAVAISAGFSQENARNLYSSKAIKLKTGNARGIGPDIQRKLDDAYPDWFLGDPPPAAAPSLDQALRVLGETLQSEDLDDVRAELADGLSRLAKWRGGAPYQKLVVDLIEGRFGKHEDAA